MGYRLTIKACEHFEKYMTDVAASDFLRLKYKIHLDKICEIHIIIIRQYIHTRSRPNRQINYN